MWARLLDNRFLRVEWTFRRRDGTLMLGELSAVVLPDGRIQGIVRDVTEQRRLEAERLKQQADLARTDSLTGTQNRRAYEEQGDQYFSVAVRHKLPIVVALMDVDRFKSVNDTLGHAEGDRVLREVGQILSSAARTSDVVARLGGDEFGFILLGVDEAGADIFFHRLVQQLDERMRARNWSVSFSIGAAACSGGLPTPDIAKKHADELLYLAKKDGGDQVVIRTFP
jgi:diguanylate cyclase (GGDEF)-like protein